ncbi:MAG: FkbM family methyltransferase [Chitinophagaceae bacterium]
MSKLYIQCRKLALSIIDKVTIRKGVKINIHDIGIRVPGRYLRYFESDYEKENFTFLKENIKPGMTCVDIGGHIGIYAVFMAKMKVGKVFCFEPTPASFTILKKTVSLNHCENIIHIYQAAIAENTGKSYFYINKYQREGKDTTRIAEGNSLVYFDSGENILKEKFEVPTFSLDDFARQHNLKIDFIKIDAEGAELDILKGAQKTILKDRPAGILSIHTFTFPDKGKTLLDIWEIAKELHLKLLFANTEITKQEFLTTDEKGLFDLQFIPNP